MTRPLRKPPVCPGRIRGGACLGQLHCLWSPEAHCPVQLLAVYAHRELWLLVGSLKSQGVSLLRKPWASLLAHYCGGSCRGVPHLGSTGKDEHFQTVPGEQDKTILEGE